MPPSAPPPAAPRPGGPAGTLRRASRDARAWLAAYLVALALIGFWPTHVDQGAGPLLRAITDAVPWLTYDRMQFGANVVLFAPFGALLMLILTRRFLIVPIALCSSVFIESVQALMGGSRTPDINDVFANLTGACAGMLAVAAIEWRRSRRAPRTP